MKHNQNSDWKKSFDVVCRQKSERWRSWLQVKPGRAQDEQFKVVRLRLDGPEQSDHQSAVMTRRRGGVDAEE